MTDPSHEELLIAIADVEQKLKDKISQPLSSSEVQHYLERGWVMVRGIIPERMADVIREQIILEGFKKEGDPLDADDPTTWGRKDLVWQDRFISETSYYGRRIGFGRALEREFRPDLDDRRFALLQQAWQVTSEFATCRFNTVLDQLVGSGEWFNQTEEGLKKSLHVRYGLPAKDPYCSEDKFRWPLFGWHIDGKNHFHFLGRKVEQDGEKRTKSDQAVVGMLAFNKILPHGGITGIITSSHKTNMLSILAREARGGISNARILVGQSLFGGKAVDPIAECDEKVMRAGDAIFMHSHLTHSSAWNYQPNLRLGMHLQFQYKQPMDRESIAEMGRRQGHEPLQVSSLRSCPFHGKLTRLC